MISNGYYPFTRRNMIHFEIVFCVKRRYYLSMLMGVLLENIHHKNYWSSSWGLNPSPIDAQIIYIFHQALCIYGIGLKTNVLGMFQESIGHKKSFTSVPSGLRSCPPGGGRQLSSVLREGGGLLCVGWVQSDLRWPEYDPDIRRSDLDWSCTEILQSSHPFFPDTLYLKRRNLGF